MLYLGRKRIASGGGTTTVTAHQFTNTVSDVKMNGVASLGVLDTIVRADHIHPTDTSREPAFSKNTAFNKNFETSTTEIKANGTVSVGSSDNIARADHIHPFSDAETFAENERVKSKNLLYISSDYTFSNGENASNGSSSKSSQTITFNIVANTSGSDVTVFANINPIVLKAGHSYTFSTRDTSGNLTTVNAQYPYARALGAIWCAGSSNVWANSFDLNAGRSSQTITPSSDITITRICGNISGNLPNTSSFTLKFQIEEGSTATSYQEYNGAIVHQKEMEGYAQELVGFAHGGSITNSTLTTLQEYIDLFDQNYPMSYRCGIGNDHNSNFKTLVGNPLGQSNVIAFISPVIYGNSGTSEFGWKIWKVYGVGKYTPHFKVGYLIKWDDPNESSHTNDYVWSGWTTVY